MEESAPKTPSEDILTPQDSLESTNTMSVTPNAPKEGTSLEGTAPVLPQPSAQQPPAGPAPSLAPETEAPDVAPQRHIAGIFQNKLFRKVGLTSAALLAVILLMVGATFVYQKTHTPQLSESEQLAKIQDQSVKFSATGAANGPSSLRVGVPTMFVNGDISLQGVLRVSNGTTGYGQFDGTGLTGKYTYKLPNASGTVCLDSGNCAGVSSAQLAALGLSVASLVSSQSTSTTTTTATTNGGVQSVNGSTGTINLQGTVNQIIITAADGTVTFALPQDIAFDSTPTFGGLTLTGTGTQNGAQICDDTNNCGFARGDLAILQGGNDYGTNIIVGSYSNYGLSLITNNTNRLSITNNGLITLGGATTDRLRFLGEISGSSPLVFQGAVDNFFRTTLLIAEPTANRNITLPNADGIVCLTSGNCSGAGGYGDVLNGGNNVAADMSVGTTNLYGFALKTNNANRLLISNTGAINLLGNVTASADLIIGSSSANRLTLNSQILGGVPFVFQGPTDNSFTTSFAIADPSANRVITLPDADGTICLTSGNCSGPGGSGDVLNGGNNFGGTMSVGTNNNADFILKTSNAARVTISSAGNTTMSGNLTVNGSTTLGDSNTDRLTINAQILGDTPFVFQGATDNAFATFFRVEDPTGTRNIILPNADGIICLSSGNCSTSGSGGDVLNGGNTVTGTMVLGTNNNFGLTLKTDNTPRITISNTGLTTVLASFVVDGDTLLGASSSNSLTLQGSNLFAPNDLNIDSYTQYIDTLNNTVGFGTVPGSGARVNILATNGGDALTVNNGNSSGNILNLQDNGVNVVTVANSGYTTFKNTIDNVAAFQIQNAVGNTLLNADTTHRTVNINGGPSTFTFTPSGDLLINKRELTTAANTSSTPTWTADFNRDGWMDIVVGTGSTGTSPISVLMNDGTGNFANKVDYSSGGQVTSVRTGFINNDLWPDIAVTYTNSGLIGVFLNNGNGTFPSNATNYSTGLAGGTGGGSELADFDGDGDLDFALSTNIATNVGVVMFNNGSGVFSSPLVISASGGASRELIAPDLNKDGFPDLVISRANQSGFLVFMNNGNSTFGTAIPISIPGTTNGFSYGDLNGDTYPDVVAYLDPTSTTPTDQVYVYLNNGLGTLGTPTAYGVGIASIGNLGLNANIAVADYNGDSFQDIIAANYTSGTVSILLNNGSGVFGNQNQYTGGVTPAYIHPADFNNDGKNDVVIGNNNQAKVSVMYGNGGVTTVSNSLSVLPATVNHTGIYVKANVSQASDLIRVVDSGGSNAMFSIGATGAALFKNGTDSANAFQLQTAAGSTALNFDSTNNKISLYNNGSTNMGAFSATSSLPAVRAQHMTVAYNGYVYAIGGNGGSAQSTAYYASVTGSTVNTWNTTTSLPVALYNATAVATNGYVYVIGGTTANANGNALNTVYYAQINGNGTLGTWNTTTSLPSQRYAHSTVIANGYMYVIGGVDNTGAVIGTTYYAAINGNGTIGAWQTGNALPITMRVSGAVAHNGFVYMMGGGNGSNVTLNTIYYAPLNANGSVGTWVASGVTLPYATQAQQLFSYGGQIYMLGGCSGALSAGTSCNSATATYSNVSYVQPNGDGSLNAWQTSTTSSILGGRGAFGAAVLGSYVYITGGYFPGNNATSTVYSAALPGSNSGTTFNSSSATFNTTVNIQNADSTYLMTANPSNNTLTVGATTTFKNISNSTGAFQVQNAAGTNMLNIDTTNRNLSVNNAPSTYSYVTPGPLLLAKTDYASNGNAKTDVKLADLNNDTFQDMVVSNGSVVSVYINNGSGGFPTRVDYTPGTTPQGIVLTDLNGDNRPDIAVTNNGSNNLSVFINSGTGTFTGPTNYPTATAPSGIASADFDGDNDNDLAVTHYTGSGVTASIFMNNGGGTFAAKIDYGTSSNNTGIAAADLNGDNRADLVIGAQNLGFKVLMNSGTNGTFGAATTYEGASNYQYITVADFNGDSRPDIAATNRFSNLMYVNLNTGTNGTFGAKVDYATNSTPHDITNADFNGDGIKDLVVTHSISGGVNGIGVFIGNGNGSFGIRQDYTSGSLPQRVAAADLNNNGIPDIAVGNQSAATISVLMGNGSTTTVKTSLSVVSAATTDTVLYVKGVTGQTADLVRIADGNGTPVLGIGASGAILFKNSVDSTSAFQVQNSVGTSILNIDSTTAALTVGASASFKNVTNSTTALQVQDASSNNVLVADTTNKQISIAANTVSAVGSMTQNATNIPDNFTSGASVTSAGYIYAIGGNNGAAKNTVYYARLNADGSAGSWTTSGSTLPVALYQHRAVAANGYIYVIGGTDAGGTSQSAVYYAKQSADGSIGAWTTNANPLTAARSGLTVAVANGYVYAIGGFNGITAQTSVYYAALNSNGSTGAWTTSGNSLPLARGNAGYGVANGFVYVFGGSNGTTAQSSVYYAALNTNGTVGSWTLSGNTLPGIVSSTTAVVGNGNAYILGGHNGTSGISAIYTTTLNSNGSTGTWTTATSTIPDTLYQTTGLAANGYTYLLGGFNGTSLSNKLYYTRLPGLSTGTVISGSSAVVNGTLQIQNADGSSLLTANNLNNTVSIGVASDNPTLLLFGQKTTDGDPTGTNGAMYYNTFNNKFRCYQNGAWIDCAGSGATGAFVQDGNSFTANATLGTNDNFSLNFETAGLTVATLGTNGAAVFKNSTNSTTAFQIQNATTGALFTADTSGNLIKIGGAASSTPTLLQLADGNNVTDPTGVAGAMYYNSAINRFRCYENGGWKNCITAGGGAGGGDILNGGNSGLGNMIIGNIDAGRLDLITANQVRLRIGAAGNVMINSTGTAGAAEKFRVNTPTLADASAATILAGTATGDKVLVVQGMLGQTANLQEWQTSNGVARVAVTSGGELRIYDSGGVESTRFVSSANGSLSILTTAASGSSVSINPDGGLNLGTGSTDAVVIGRSSADRTITMRGNTVMNATSSTTALTVRGVTSQTANLQEWQTVGNVVAAYVDANGYFNINNGAGLDRFNSQSRVRAAAGTGLYVTDSGGNGIYVANGGNVGINNTAPGNKLSVNAPTTADSLAQLLVATGSASNKGMVLQSAASQTANLLEFQDSTGAVLSYFGPAGTYFAAGGSAASPGLKFATATTSGFFNPTSTTSVGVSVAATEVARFNARGLQIGSTGAIGTVERFRVNTPTTVDNLAASILGTGADANKGLVVQGNSATQSANLFEIQSSAGAVLSSFRANGALTIGSTSALGTVEKFRVNTPTTVDNTAASTLATGGAANKGLVVQGAASQTASLQEWQSSTGAALASITSAGDLVFGQGANHVISISQTTTVDGVGKSLSIQAGQGNGNGSGGDLNLFGGATGAGNLGGGSVNIAGSSSFVSGGNVNITAGIGGVVQGIVAIQSGSNGSGTYGASNLNANGGRVNIGAVLNSAKLSIVNDTNTTGDVVLAVRGSSGQTGKLQEWQNSGATVVASMDNSGNLVINGSLNIATGNLQVAGTTRINNSGTLLNVTYNGNTIGTQYGGTGATSFNANGVLFGNGTGTLQATAAGNSGQCLIATTGSAPSWGSCAPASAGNVNQGGNNFGTGMSIGTTDNFGLTLLVDNHAALVFDDEARATFKNKSDATTAFQVQNAAGTSLFNIDSANNRIYVGNATPDSIGTLLVLDTKNTSGDPTGVDGAMYYNSNLAKFRCYEDGAWKDCIYSSKTAAKTADQTFGSTSYASVNDLSFNVVANKAYRLSCSLLLSVPSGTNGGNVSMTGPASPTQYTATFMKSLDQSGGDNYATSSSYDDGSAATTFKVNTVSTGANRFIVNFNAVLMNGANAGTWQLRAKAFDGSSSITFYANSSCNMLPL